MDYRVQYYTNSRTFQKPARDFIFSLPSPADDAKSRRMFYK